MQRSPERRRSAAPVLAAAAVLAAVPALAQQPGPTVEARVTTADGADAGMVIFRELAHGVVVQARLENLPEGTHGFHIHETGRCAPDFSAAGGHYDPTGAAHGFDTADGFHVGDLPNLVVGPDGRGMADVFTQRVTLDARDDDQPPFTLRDADGSAIMVHARGDDHRAEPAGSTGERIACGVIVPPG